MSFIFNAFTSKDIINAVNQSLLAGGCKVKAVAVLKSNSNIITLTTNRGAQLVAILGSFSQSSFFIRGIHRICDKSRPYTYLFNGQSGKNIDTLIFTGESGQVFYATEDAYRLYVKEILKIQSSEKIKERVLWEAKTNPLINEPHKEYLMVD